VYTGLNKTVYVTRRNEERRNTTERKYPNSKYQLNSASQN